MKEKGTTIPGREIYARHSGMVDVAEATGSDALPYGHKSDCQDQRHEILEPAQSKVNVIGNTLERKKKSVRGKDAPRPFVSLPRENVFVSGDE